MQVIIRDDENSAANLTAAIIARRLCEKPDLVLGLATGRTMELVYARLAEMHRAGKLDFTHCRTFNLDEYIGLAPENVNSYRYYMNKHLFGKINIKMENTHLPDGVAIDLKKECLAYDQKIKDVGGINLQLLGIGESGHIGFNEPLSSLLSRTRDKTLTETTIAQNAPLFKSRDQVPRRALTMGIGNILESHTCLLLATGKRKAEIIAKAVEGPITSMVSASALQLHPHCHVILDEDAAGGLQETDYYKWIFRNEPDWQEFQDY